MAKSIKSNSRTVAQSRNNYLSKTAGSALSQTTKSYGISSDSKTKKTVSSSSVKVSSKMTASAASKVLRDGRYGEEKKSIAGRALSNSKKKK